jgi:hypothetical protein
MVAPKPNGRPAAAQHPRRLCRPSSGPGPRRGWSWHTCYRAGRRGCGRWVDQQPPGDDRWFGAAGLEHGDVAAQVFRVPRTGARHGPRQTSADSTQGPRPAALPASWRQARPAHGTRVGGQRKRRQTRDAGSIGPTGLPGARTGRSSPAVRRTTISPTRRLPADPIHPASASSAHPDAYPNVRPSSAPSASRVRVATSKTVDASSRRHSGAFYEPW